MPFSSGPDVWLERSEKVPLSEPMAMRSMLAWATGMANSDAPMIGINFLMFILMWLRRCRGKAVIVVVCCYKPMSFV
jgi:hypothetical protein